MGRLLQNKWGWSVAGLILVRGGRPRILDGDRHADDESVPGCLGNAADIGDGAIDQEATTWGVARF